jgi:hypothetical protein
MCMHQVRQKCWFERQFYEELEQDFYLFPKYDMEIILGYFHAKEGWEIIFKPTIGNESLHQDSNDKGVRIVNFATSKNLVVKSMIFPHRSIHKYTWTSPDGKTQPDWSHIDRQEMTFERTRCTKFLGSWLWYWLLSGDCKSLGKIDSN